MGGIVCRHNPLFQVIPQSAYLRIGEKPGQRFRFLEAAQAQQRVRHRPALRLEEIHEPMEGTQIAVD